jgi:hypothetical protein
MHWSDRADDEEEVPTFRRERASRRRFDNEAFDDPRDDREFHPLPHSRFGVASFVLAVVTGILLFVLCAIAGIMETTAPGGIDENSPVMIVLGLLLIGGLFVELLAVALGVAGLFERRRMKVFAVLGAALGAIALLGGVFLVILGLVAG